MVIELNAKLQQAQAQTTLTTPNRQPNSPATPNRQPNSPAQTHTRTITSNHARPTVVPPGVPTVAELTCPSGHAGSEYVYIMGKERPEDSLEFRCLVYNFINT